MRKVINSLSVIILLVLAGCTSQMPEDSSLKLWYQQPAQEWTDALPVGNGRLGAMVFGNPFKERIQLNEESLWAGTAMNSNNPEAYKHLKEVQQLILDGKIKESVDLASATMLGTPPRVRSYQTLGDIFIDYGIKDTTNYRRELDLNTGVAKTTFTSQGVDYTQDVFASAPDNLIVIHLKASKKGALNATIRLEREKDAVVKADIQKILMDGQIVDVEDSLAGPGGPHMKFAAQLKAPRVKNGTVSIEGQSMVIKGSDEIVLLFTAATDYNLKIMNYDRSINPAEVCEQIINKPVQPVYDKLLQKHLKEYAPMFHRVSLHLGTQSNLPTDVRLKAVKEGAEDPDLVALYFQYGRYLLMGSSRYPGVMPANLQGIWNKDFEAAWNADFHTNINLQMNYWPAEVCNLSETALPLTNFFRALERTASETARETYGARGWTVHHLTDAFGRTSVMDGIWGCFPMGGPWMTFSFYEHYAFTGDETYLREQAYPLMKTSAQFVLDFLIKDKKGQWVTAPSNSPENRFVDPATGQPTNMTYAATMDIQVITELFNNCIKSAKVLNTDEAFCDTLRNVMANLPPVKISPTTGGIQEWIEDYKEWEVGHRHISHLLGLHPGTQITPLTPELFEGAKKTILRRLGAGGGHTGWSRAWIINFYARLLDAENAHFHVQELLRKSTLSNLFDTHPPFQIDGNFGGSAGIAEMLVQSHAGYIHLLPTLPVEWNKGSFTGLKARDNFEIDCAWEAGKLTEGKILSKNGHDCSVLYQYPFVVKQGNKEVAMSEPFDIAGVTYYKASFPTKKDECFTVKTKE